MAMANPSNRNRVNTKNYIFTILMAVAVAIVAAVILLVMTLSGRFAQPAQEPVSSLVSEVTSSAVSEPEDTSSAVSGTEETPGTSSEDTSSAVSDLVLPGTLGEITQRDDRLLVVVNQNTPLPKSFETNLTKLDGIKVDKKIAKIFDALYSDAAKEKVYLWITYGYRTEAEQKQIYNANVKRLMQEEGYTKKEAKALADRTVQRAGWSEYVTGLSVGFNTGDDAFAKTPEYRWLVEHAADYGFVLRYPQGKETITGVEFQPWRFRYVGKKHAKAMEKLGYCLEEYVVYLNSQDKNTK